MKKEETEQHRLDEQSIEKAAAAALHDLQLDIEVKSVSADGDSWCVQFVAEYRQFCDSFRDQFGKENSFELIREKIKRSLLKQQQNKIRSGVRIRRGKTEQRRPASDGFVQTALKTIEGAVGQTAEVAGEIIKQASRLPEQALSALDDVVGGASQTTTPPLQSVQDVEQPLARVRIKAAAKSTAKSTRKSSRTTRQATSKKRTATKAAKKTAGKSKRAAAKSTAKSVKKRTGTKSRKKAK